MDWIAQLEASVPEILIAGLAFGGDHLGAAEGGCDSASGNIRGVLRATSTGLEIGATMLEPTLEVENFDVAIAEALAAGKLEIQNQLVALKSMLGAEAEKEIAVFHAQEALRQLSDACQSRLSEGIALIEERQDFNRSSAGAVQQLRYQDITFRVFRNDALAAYRSSFDLAARYAWLAAKAYDYETNLDPNDAASAQGILECIMKAETLGTFAESTAAAVAVWRMHCRPASIRTSRC